MKVTRCLLLMLCIAFVLGAGSAALCNVKLKCKGQRGKVVIQLRVTELKNKAPYTLCLNGHAGQAGNDLLGRVPGHKVWNDEENYLDFATVDSNGRGVLSYNGSVALPRGNYDITFLVKDVDDGYKCVVTRDHVRFTVQ